MVAELVDFAPGHEALPVVVVVAHQGRDLDCLALASELLLDAVACVLGLPVAVHDDQGLSRALRVEFVPQRGHGLR